MPKRGQLISTAGETADKRKFDFIMKKAFVLIVLLLMATSACAQVPSAKDAKFVGNVLGRGKGGKGVDAAFAKYWNQVTPENAGKWGSVERERNRLAWDRLDVLYQFCLQHGIPFKQHTFVWGMQQPEWIANLPPGEQRKEVEDWIKSFCERYPKTAMIDVVNEPITHPPKQYYGCAGRRRCDGLGLGNLGV